MTDPAPLPPRVLAALAAVRRRRRVLAVVQALAWSTLGLAVLVVGAAVLVGPEPLSDGMRWAARAWLAGSLLLPFALFVVPPWRRTADPLALARAIDDRSATDDALWTAVDLSRALDRLEDEETLRLARRHLDHAADQATAVDPKALVPWSVLAAARQAGPVGLVLLVAVFVGLPDDARRGLDRLLGPGPEVDATVAAEEEEPVTLVLRNVALTLTPPAYSEREPLELPGTTGDFQALPGTHVVFEADSPVSGKTARLVSKGVVLAESKVKGKHLKFNFKSSAEGSGTYRVRMTKGMGSDELVTRAFRVDALPDKAPELEVVGPTTGIELRPGQTVPLEIRTSDDFALTRLERVVERNGVEVARSPVADVAGRAEVVERFRWDPMQDLPNAGGELALVIESFDNDDVNGPKRTRSRPLEIYIPTARDQHAKVLALQEQLLGAALDLLAEMLVDTEGLRNPGRVAVLREGVLRDHRVQQRVAGQLFEVARRLAEAMQRDSLARPDSFIGTARLMENLARRWSPIEEYVEREIENAQSPMVNQGVVAGLVVLRDDAISELEQAVLDLADFIDLDRASDALAEVAELDQSFASLADLVREGADGEIVDDERIKEALEELKQAMAEAAKKLQERRGGPDDGFQNKLPPGADQQALDSIEKALEEGRYEDAMRMIQQAQEALAKQSEGLQREMDSMSGSQESEELAKALNEAIEQTRALEARQAALREETDGLIEQFGSGDGMDANQQERILREMDALMRDIAEIPVGIGEDALRSRAERWARRAYQAADAMRGAFAEGGVEEAIALGVQTQRELQRARQGLEVRASGELAVPGAARAEGQAQAASDRTGELIRLLEQAQKKVDLQRRAAGGGSSSQHQAQNRLAMDTAGLRRTVEEMGGSAFNPVAGRDSLRSAEDLMLRAGAKLDQGRPGRAAGAQDGALQQLRRFRESLQQAQGAMGQGRMPSGAQMAGGQQSGRRNPWENMNDFQGSDDEGEVEMPEPEDFLGPDAFRALVLEGAQDDTPERYRPLNGSYYEELVR